MTRGKKLSSDERKTITQKLAHGNKACQIAHHLSRDTRTIKKAINATTDRDCRRNKVIIKQINQSKLISQSCWSDWVWQLVGMNILWLLGAI